MSCQQAIRAGSSVCIQVPNELIAASRWLRVETPLCRLFLQVAEERRDGAGVEVVEGELARRDRPLVAEPGDQELERVAVGGDRVGRAAAQPGQVGGEEAAQGDREVSRHGRPSGGGRHDVADSLLDAGGDVGVGLGGQPQVVGGVADRGMAHVGLQDRQQRVTSSPRRTRTAGC